MQTRVREILVHANSKLSPAYHAVDAAFDVWCGDLNNSKTSFGTMYLLWLSRLLYYVHFITGLNCFLLIKLHYLLLSI